MNTISENLLKAIDHIATTRQNAQTGNDKTIQATIVEVMSLEEGKFLVNYQGGDFIAWDENKKSYKEEERVYVKIPGGDMSNKKIIEGPVATLKEYEEDKKNFETYTPNMLRNVVENKYTLPLTRYTKDNKKCWSLRTNLTITFEDGEDWDEFYQYMKLYSSIMFTADFQTQNFYGGYSGDYGIIIDFYEAGQPEPITKKLNKEVFNGSYYQFGAPAQQTINFENKKFDCEKVVLTLFAEDLMFRDIVPEGRTPQIIVSDIALYFTSPVGLDVPHIIESKEEKVETTIIDGIEEYKGTTTTLIPSLYWGGKQITSNLKWSWYQYIPNSTPASAEGYLAAAGIDWKRIDMTAQEIEEQKKKDENYKIPEVYRDKDKLILTYNEKQNRWKKKYFKAIATIGTDECYASKEIVINNQYQNHIKFTINAANQEFTFVAKDTNKFSDNNVTSEYSLYFEFNENKNLNSGKNQKLTNSTAIEWEIPNQVFTAYTTREFTYYVYWGNGFVEKGSLYYVDPISGDSNQAGTLPIEGTNVFLYNSTGLLKSGTNEFTITIPNAIEINNIKHKVKNLKWFWKNGTIAVGDGSINLDTSMISAITPIEDDDEFYNSVKFTVRKNFIQSYARDNYFTITYSLNGKPYTQRHYLQFSIEGQMGTNGTGWMAYIDERGSKNILNNFVDGSTSKLDEVLFTIKVFKDGVEAEPMTLYMPNNKEKPSENEINVSNTACNYVYSLEFPKMVNCIAKEIHLAHTITTTETKETTENIEATEKTTFLSTIKEEVIQVKPDNPYSKVWEPSQPTFFQVKVKCYNGWENNYPKLEYELYLYCPVTTSAPFIAKNSSGVSKELTRLNTIYSNVPDSIMYNAAGYDSNWSSSTVITVSDSDFKMNKEKSKRINITEKNELDPLDYHVLQKENKIDAENEMELKKLKADRKVLQDELKDLMDKNSDENKIKAKQEEINVINRKIAAKETELNLILTAQVVFEKDVLDKNGKSQGKIYFYKTILFYLNRYGNEAINSWDGQSVELNEKGGYILSPTFGAGKKNEQNQFTGVIMGIDSQENKTGIYGYKDGEKTFGIDEDGDAYFKGNIVANSLTLGDNFNAVDTDFAVLGTTYGSNTNFTLSKEGLLRADNAIISGEIHAGKGGTLAGWSINENNITKEVKVLEGSESDKIEYVYTSTLQATDGTPAQAAILAITKKPTSQTSTWARPIAKIDYTGEAYFSRLYLTKPNTTKGYLDFEKDVICGKFTDNDIIDDNDIMHDAVTYNGIILDISSGDPIILASTDKNTDILEFGSSRFIESSEDVFRIQNSDIFNLDADGSYTALTVSGLDVSVTDEESFNYSFNSIDQNRWNLDCSKDARGHLHVSSNGVSLNAFSNTTTSSSVCSLWCAISGGGFSGTWKMNGASIATTSDLNKKNTIIPISSIYSQLFDRIQPVAYKYNDGTSDRLHTGFIAQQIKNALDETNINSQNFAGYVVDINEETGEETCYLRYEEFIALNTNEIQKSKAKIVELEKRITELENLLQVNS